ncbi:MAG: TonB-dependent receptor [Hydrocarboniphaga sp.]|uniref:TonB-dependent receptor plug domain-containing protein n=1 Tax=Hydrocarboniphaga sp. TaxID=2033016 RepID=UPI0026311F8F|nr:TonB-dependent receptor [Hydrocarboniphaga sp.]MDB5972105.1 TonB-dependent receptor [Hydrocarboniphaga sp.]
MNNANAVRVGVKIDALEMRQAVWASFKKRHVKTLAYAPLMLGAELALLAAPAAHAADEPATTEVAAAGPEVAASDDTAVLDEVIVTGTRRSGGLQVSESPAPIQVLSAETLKSAGAPDLIASIAQLVPSFTAQAFGGDQANQTLSAKLRGLSPNHALVLVNGKRRHTTASLAVLGGPYQGAASADLNFIPASAIERIEVLTDGAAAQYGTDAIAGVINIILKNGYEGGLVDSTYGKYYDGGGDTIDHSGNIGFGSGPEAFLNLTAEVRNKQRSDRGNPDPRVTDPDTIASYPNSNVTLLKGYPYLNHIMGDPEIHTQTGFFNSGYTVGSVDLYSFGSYGQKKANSYENYRMPSRASHQVTTTDSAGDTTTTTEYYYPFGFNPRESTEETDLSWTSGARGVVSGWNWDLSSTYGKDTVKIGTIDSLNTDLYAATGASPTNFDDGAYVSSQWTTNLDVSHEYTVGLAGPLTTAFGVEQRHETYELQQGDPASTYGSGASSFPGIQESDASKNSRDNYALYADFSITPIEKLLLDAAVRYEHFSDFGSTTIGKLTGRYDFTPAFALRGTVSTGFRAPTLAEEYYTATNVGPSTAFVQLAPNAPAASLLGLGDGLKPEKSTNFSLGVVMHPTDRITATVDAYQIEIRDRIVASGSLYSEFQGEEVEGADSITAAIIANGNVLDPTVTTKGISIFANGLTTRTRGVDMVLSYPGSYAFGRIDWTASANYNKTEITKINASPAELGGQSLYDETAQSDLTDASPKFRVNFSAAYSFDARFYITLRETLYGKSSEQVIGDDGAYYKNEIGVTPITDLELAFKPTASVKLSIGANNLFNTYPDKVNSDLLKTYTDAVDNAAVTKYPSFSPFGFNGGYYYGKVSYTF